MARVGELEAAVMRELWGSDRALTVREVLERLQHSRAPERSLAYTTVMTVLERLFRKDLLVREEQEKAFRYQPAQTQADYTAQVMAKALGDASDRSEALVHFAGQLTDEERRTLRQALSRVSGRPARR